jgi:AcrR family transcriptional regulator
MKSTSNDPRALRTRQLLREALMDSVIEKNFRDLTIRDITDHAGVNRATFYLHYEDKYDLLDDCANEIFLEIRSAMQNEMLFDPEKSMIVTGDELKRMKIILNHIQRDADFFRAMMRDDGDTTFHNLFRETASKWMKAQVVEAFAYHNKDVDDDLIDMMVRFQSAGNFEVISWWLENDMRIPIEVMAARLATITMPPLIRLLINDSIEISN